MSITLQSYCPFPTLTFLYCIPFSGVTPWINHLHNGSILSAWVTVVWPLPRAIHTTGGNHTDALTAHAASPSPRYCPCEVVVVLKNNERVLQNKKNVKFCMKFQPFFILFINMVMNHTHLNLHVNFSRNL